MHLLICCAFTVKHKLAGVRVHLHHAQANPKLALAMKMGIANVLSRANATLESGDATLPVHVGFLRDIQRAADVLVSRLQQGKEEEKRQKEDPEHSSSSQSFAAAASASASAAQADQSSSSPARWWWRDVEHRADRLRAKFDERHAAQRKITSRSIVFRPWNLEEHRPVAAVQVRGASGDDGGGSEESFAPARNFNIMYNKIEKCSSSTIGGIIRASSC